MDDIVLVLQEVIQEVHAAVLVVTTTQIVLVMRVDIVHQKVTKVATEVLEILQAAVAAVQVLLEIMVVVLLVVMVVMAQPHQ